MRLFPDSRLQDFFAVAKGENEMDIKKLLRYTMQLAMLKQLLTKKLIDEMKYSFDTEKTDERLWHCFQYYRLTNLLC